MRTQLRLNLTEIRQPMQEERDLFLEFQTNYGISFEKEISQSVMQLVKALEENDKTRKYVRIFRSFIIQPLLCYEKNDHRMNEDPEWIFEIFERNCEYAFTETLILINAKLGQT